jgi:ATP-dependent DNA helicase RecQ
MRRLCDTLRRDTLPDFDPEKLTRLLKSFAEPFGDGEGQRGFFALRPAGIDSRHIKLLRSWRRSTPSASGAWPWPGRAQPVPVPPAGQHAAGHLQAGRARSGLQADITLAGLGIRNWERGAVIGAALPGHQRGAPGPRQGGVPGGDEHRTQPEARRRQFSKADYAELALHYKDKIVQVHVMAEYAKLAIRKIQAAMALVIDYFSLDRAEFVRRYFAGRKDVLEIATTEAAHRRILTSLATPTSRPSSPRPRTATISSSPARAPARPASSCIASPGCCARAWRCPRRSWCSPTTARQRSRSAAACGRWWADAAGVTVQTLHSLAMRLTGTSYAVALERGEVVDFGAVIRMPPKAARGRTGRRRRSLRRARPPAGRAALPAGG